MRLSACSLGVGSFLLACSATAVPLVPFFTPIGDLPGGATFSQAFRISGDGTTVVGRSESAAGNEAVVWTSGAGLVSLGDLPGGSTNAFALGVSSGGTVVVGLGSSASSDPSEAFRWTQAEDIVPMGDLPGGVLNSVAFESSADGSVIVGYGTTASGREAWRWTEATGLVPLGVLPGATDSIARGVSADGSVVVGGGQGLAWRWTSATGMVPLGAPPGGYPTETYDVSPDGSVVAGAIVIGTNSRLGFRWTEADGYEFLPDLPGGTTNSGVRGVSTHGEVAVGVGDTTGNDAGDRAVYWTADGQIHRMDALLQAWGLDLGDLTLVATLSVSDDGLSFAGRGLDASGNELGWVAGVPSFTAPVPEPGPGGLLLLGALATLAQRRTAGARHRLLRHPRLRQGTKHSFQKPG